MIENFFHSRRRRPPLCRVRAVRPSPLRPVRRRRLHKMDHARSPQRRSLGQRDRRKCLADGELNDPLAISHAADLMNLALRSLWTRRMSSSILRSASRAAVLRRMLSLVPRRVSASPAEGHFKPSKSVSSQSFGRPGVRGHPPHPCRERRCSRLLWIRGPSTASEASSARGVVLRGWVPGRL